MSKNLVPTEITVNDCFLSKTAIFCRKWLRDRGYRARFCLRRFPLRLIVRRYAVGVIPYFCRKSRTKWVFDVMPTCFRICLIVRNVVRNIFSALRSRQSFRYWAGLVPVSCLKRCRKRDGERFTSTASVAVSHGAAVSAFIFEMMSSILRSTVMRPRNEECA